MPLSFTEQSFCLIVFIEDFLQNNRLCQMQHGLLNSGRADRYHTFLRRAGLAFNHSLPPASVQSVWQLERTIIWLLQWNPGAIRWIKTTLWPTAETPASNELVARRGHRSRQNREAAQHLGMPFPHLEALLRIHTVGQTKQQNKSQF